MGLFNPDLLVMLEIAHHKIFPKFAWSHTAV